MNEEMVLATEQEEFVIFLRTETKHLQNRQNLNTYTKLCKEEFMNLFINMIQCLHVLTITSRWE